jgi:hypothetical protein
VRLAAVAAIAAPALERLPGSKRRDHERGRRVRPPPAEQRIREQADEQRDREVGESIAATKGRGSRIPRTFRATSNF